MKILGFLFFFVKKIVDTFVSGKAYLVIFILKVSRLTGLILLIEISLLLSSFKEEKNLNYLKKIKRPALGI